MAKSVCLVFDKSLELRKLMTNSALYLNLKDVSSFDTNSFQFLDDVHNSYVDFLKMPDQDSVFEDYFDNDLLSDKFRASLENKLYYLVSFDSIDLVKKILEISLASLMQSDCWVDNDDGVVMRVDHFLV